MVGLGGEEEPAGLSLSVEGGLALRANPGQAMYQDLREVLGLIKSVLEEGSEGEVHWHRTVESGAIEEYVVFERGMAGKRLLFRVWPFFFPYKKRLEYRLYIEDREVCDQVLHCLESCAATNGASLVSKGAPLHL